MTDVPDIENELRSEHEHGRLRALGTSTDGGKTTLLVVHELDDSWTFHGLGAPGVKLSKANTIALAESILERVR
ncbi:MAG: hypothetical protein ACRDS9_22125 [Pseudonocardiaceae bacterium]